jgi:hypothetical protein
MRFSLRTLLTAMTLLAWVLSIRPMFYEYNRIIAWPTGASASDATIVADYVVTEELDGLPPDVATNVEPLQGNRRFNVSQRRYRVPNLRLLFPVAALSLYIAALTLADLRAAKAA